MGPFPNYPSPQCPLELQSAGLGCTSLAELEEENVLNLPTNQFLYTTSPHKNSRQACLCQFSSCCAKTEKSEKIERKKTKGNFVVYLCFTKLTLNDQGDPLADRGRDLVAGDAEVRSHLFS